MAVDNELLQEEIQELNDQKTKLEEHLMEFTEQINERIEEWQVKMNIQFPFSVIQFHNNSVPIIQTVLKAKDTEIKDLKSKDKISSSSASSSPKQIQPQMLALQNLLTEREHQLMELQSKLEVAVTEMEESTQLIEDLKKDKENNRKTIDELNTVRRELKKQLKVTHERCQKLQEEVDFAEKIAEEKSSEVSRYIVLFSLQS